MLVLTRKVDEAIRIGDDIRLVVTRIDTNQVRIGIETPRNLPVYREEVYNQVLAANRSAKSVDSVQLEKLRSTPAKENNNT